MANCIVVTSSTPVIVKGDTPGVEWEELFTDVENVHLATCDDLLENVSEHIRENLDDELVKEALEEGVELREYSERVKINLKFTEDGSVTDQIGECVKVAQLHTQVGACECVLESMEDMLHGFQHALSSISSEIQSLQEQSVAMNVKLKNRQAVKGELSQVIDEISVHESMISTILETPVTHRHFLEQLYELNHKIKFIKQHSFNDTLACRDIEGVVQNLKVKAVTKIREYLLQRVYSFRKPMSNYEVPQAALLKSRFFYEFLLSNGRRTAKEVQDEYIDTMSKIYSSYFKTYISRLMKLQYEDTPDKEDLIAAEDSVKRGFFSSKTVLKNRATTFSLGSRALILTADLESPVIVPHVAQDNNTKYPFESIFRSEHFTFKDNACREFLFLCDFFLVTKSSAQELFNNVFGKTISMLIKHISSYVSGCFDAIALILCIHIVEKYRVDMERRNVHALSQYWETVQDILWPRFEQLVRMHCQSIKTCDVYSLSFVDIRPHYITRRYAEFSAGVAAVNKVSPSKVVDKVLEEMQEEVQKFISRLASTFSSRKDQLIFLINNYDMMLNVILERTKDETKESDDFRCLLNTSVEEYSEEMLSLHFHSLISFVKQAEPLAESGQLVELHRMESRILPLAKSFAKNWKTSLEDINQEVMKSFSNFKNGTAILQGTLTLLVQYYHRFQKLLSHAAYKALPMRAEIVNIHQLMVEMKKYKPNF